MNTIYRQGDKRWRDQTLGRGSSTLWKGGCLVTCFAMAVERLLGKEMTPEVVNARCKVAGAFTNSMLAPREAAKALGLVLVERERDVPWTDPDLVRITNEALAAGGLAIVHVDSDNDTVGQHFVLVVEKLVDGTYLALDPAPGAEVKLSSQLVGISYWGKVAKHYKPVGAMRIARAAS